jgi:protein-tyrosine kinase
MSKAPKAFFRRRAQGSSAEKSAERRGDAALTSGRPAIAGRPMLRGSATLTPVRRAGSFDGTRGSSSRRIEIDHQLLSDAGMISNLSEHSLIAEEFRLIKRPLLLKAGEAAAPGGRPNNLIMVSSGKPNEGKTFSAVNLAMSIALERDLTVMLIDADVARPSIPAVMGIETDLGLMDLIADDSLDMSDVLLRTDIENFAVLPAGRAHHLATELFASERMERLVADITRRYPDRIIILDSPPILMSSIPAVLSLHVGQIVFVVLAEKSTQAAIDGSLRLISSCENIYLLLNRAREIGGTEKLDGYYDYYR